MPRTDAGDSGGPDLVAMDMGATDSGARDLGPADSGTTDMGHPDPMCGAALGILDCASGTVTGDTALGSSLLSDYCSATGYAGHEAIYAFDSPTTASVTITVDSPIATGAGDWDLVAYDALGGHCGMVGDCVGFDSTPGPDATLHFGALHGQHYYVSYDGHTAGMDTTFTLAVSCAPPGCGDAILGPSEECDDGNVVAGDGCSDTCTTESGYVCGNVFPAIAPASICTPVRCGNGLNEATEQCDDGNVVAGDGCSATCTIESGFVCDYSSASSCAHVMCGDGLISGAETCDDGNTTDGDGCSATCSVEPGYGCLEHGPFHEMCTMFTCGDGVRAPGEECDDGNASPADGCSATCAIEAGYGCEGATPTVCMVPTCGDAARSAGEPCDDGNAASGDGCSATCTIEGATPVPATGASTVLRGALTGADPTYVRTQDDCTPGTDPPVVYDSYVIENTGATTRSFDLTFSLPPDGFLFVYQAPFDATMPTARCLGGNLRWGARNRIERVTIAPGAQLVAVVTEYATDRARGAYFLTVDGR